MFKAYILVCLFLFAQSLDNYELKFVDNEEALCLDGTRAVGISQFYFIQSYYFAEGSDYGRDKVLFFFQGGGWIGGNDLEQTLQDAFARSSTDIGSSKNLPHELEMNGIFSRDSQKNPIFYNWNTIFLNYCDGTGHQGYATDPIDVNGAKLYFRGETIVKSVIEEVIELLTNSKQVLVSGCSAGGQATLEWVQHFRELLPETVQVLAAPDSGIFQDMEPIDRKQQPYRQFYQQHFMQIANKEVDPPNKQCVQANQYEKWKCLIAPYLLDYIEVPIFFIQSNYDQWSIPQILKASCVNDRTLRKCSPAQINYIEIHHNNNMQIIESELSKQSEGGAWVPSCVNHCFLHEDARFNNNQYRVPSEEGPTLNQAISQWVLNQGQNNIHIDFVNWPSNTGCALI